jgi:hypothetical protein
MKTRRFERSDYIKIIPWWTFRQKAVVASEYLPETGILVESDLGEPLAASWLYVTNSNAALIDWTMTNPDAPIRERSKAVKVAISALESLARDLGIRCVFGISGSRGLARTMERLGYFRSRLPHEVLLKEVTKHGS